jgi:regulator of protease activity HflC (stomatin/prohibitin superfamily)
MVLTLAAIAAALVAIAWFRSARRVEIVYSPFVGILYRDGRFEREVPPGRYAFFDPEKRVHIGHIWKPPMPVALGDVTVVSKDQFAFKVALSPVVEVIDARTFAETQPSSQVQYYTNHVALRPVVSAAALEEVASRELRELLADPRTLPQAIQQRVENAVPGARIGEILMTAVILPPETRKMFTEVERSKLEAEATLERARGEQASLRALANAARLIKDNPALANLRMLQMLERAPGAKTIVLGNGALPLGMGETAA